MTTFSLCSTNAYNVNVLFTFIYSATYWNVFHVVTLSVKIMIILEIQCVFPKCSRVPWIRAVVIKLLGAVAKSWEKNVCGPHYKQDLYFSVTLLLMIIPWLQQYQCLSCKISDIILKEIKLITQNFKLIVLKNFFLCLFCNKSCVKLT